MPYIGALKLLWFLKVFVDEMFCLCGPFEGGSICDFQARCCPLATTLLSPLYPTKFVGFCFRRTSSPCPCSAVAVPSFRCAHHRRFVRCIIPSRLPVSLPALHVLLVAFSLSRPSRGVLTIASFPRPFCLASRFMSLLIGSRVSLV